MGKNFVYGIDLGTTYSCISYVDETGRPVVVQNMEGDNTTPSVVNFASPEKVVVGLVAKENAVIDPNNTVDFVKTLMGKTNFAINYNGRDITPEEVSAYILRKVAEDAAKQLDTEVKDVVITCPAYFGTPERQATKNAGEIAGLNVLAIINEPTAAAIYYGCTKAEEEKNILVFDLGGGTFDVTIMHISADQIEVICSDGDHQLGGKNWDEAIITYLAQEFCSETGFDGEFDEYALQDMRMKAEKAKMQLSSREEVPVMLDAAGLRARITLTRDKFDELTSTLLAETIDKTDAAIEVAKGKGYTVDEILLVGGSTRMPQIMKAVTDKYGMEPKILDPDEAVAKGAAIHAVGVYNNPVQDPNADPNESEEPPKVLDVPVELIGGAAGPRKIVVATTKSYSLKVLVDGEPRCRNMIIKNNPMPDGTISETKTFGTVEANQETVLLEVFETDNMEENPFEVDEETKLGDCVLELPGNLPASSPIEVTFTLNGEGILTITGIDKSSGNQIKIDMETKGVMSQEEVENIKSKSNAITVM